MISYRALPEPAEGSEASMKAIILSAGQGRRLLPLTESTPKCALQVAGRAVLQAQLGEIGRCAIDEVVVVTGFGADRVDEIVAGIKQPRVRTLYNPFYALSDNLGTCWVASREMDGPFVLINGDTLFEAAILQTLLDSPSEAPITLVTDAKPSYDDDDMKVILQGSKLRRVGKHLREGVNGESIGMMVFRGEGPAMFRAKVENVMRYGEGVKRWYLSAIDELAQQGSVNACSIQGLSWCEVDDADDLAHAQKVVASWHQPTEQAAVS